MQVSILGTKYTVKHVPAGDARLPEGSDGCCDKTSHTILVADEKSDLDDYPAWQKVITRHEIIHAFLDESGLGNNFEHPRYGHDETYVDWIAIQLPKINRACEEAGCL